MTDDERANLLSALSIAKGIAVKDQNVQSVDFGFKYVKRVRVSSTAIRFHLADKKTPAEVTGAAMLPAQILGFPCDVIEMTYDLEDQSRSGSFEILQPGISVGNLNRDSTGTLGAIVRDLATGGLCILSNWHVLYGRTDATPRDAIGQPGPADPQEMPPRTIAAPLRAANLSWGIDAALALLSPDQKLDQQIFGLKLTPSGVGEPELDMKVVKCGRTSGITHGIVDGIEGSVRMDYSTRGDKPRWMDCIRVILDRSVDPKITDLSLEGDSGAIWIDKASSCAVALHFAGQNNSDPLAEYALAHSLPDVLQRLGAELVNQA